MLIVGVLIVGVLVEGGADLSAAPIKVTVTSGAVPLLLKGGKTMRSAVRGVSLAVALTAACLAPPAASAAPPKCSSYGTGTPYHTPVTISVACTDPDGDAIVSYQAFAGVSGASVSVNGSTVTYTPPVRFTGLDGFKYTATDAAGETSEAFVQVRVGIYRNIALKPAGGKVRVKSAGRWRTLVGKRTMPLRSFEVDARKGRVWLIYTGHSETATFVFKSRLTRGAFRAVVSPPEPRSREHLAGLPGLLKGLRLAGPMDCNRGGRGRLLRVEAIADLMIFARHLTAVNIPTRGQRTPARYTVADRCDGSSTVTNHRGRVRAGNRPTDRGEWVRPGQTYVARPPG